MKLHSVIVLITIKNGVVLCISLVFLRNSREPKRPEEVARELYPVVGISFTRLKALTGLFMQCPHAPLNDPLVQATLVLSSRVALGTGISYSLSRTIRRMA